MVAHGGKEEDEEGGTEGREEKEEQGWREGVRGCQEGRKILGTVPRVTEWEREGEEGRGGEESR